MATIQRFHVAIEFAVKTMNDTQYSHIIKYLNSIDTFTLLIIILIGMLGLLTIIQMEMISQIRDDTDEIENAIIDYIEQKENWEWDNKNQIFRAK